MLNRVRMSRAARLPEVDAVLKGEKERTRKEEKENMNSRYRGIAVYALLSTSFNVFGPVVLQHCDVEQVVN